ncbi:glycoside hydrolase family 65 protein [Vallitalea guaymasensis]|uniref:glycoside hydrolase family 65 protein n=1 Tax=Vallitalea guaymasensis TaxID=1185412 RepID=UPI000DE358FE|nr:glycosyl hydrolase family 65 protein [Vallitalea guaymasensis]
MSSINLWGYTEKNFQKEKYPLNETLFALGNGYIGTRGSFEEKSDFGGHDGTFINGFYDYYDLSYGEKYNGYPDRSHAMLNVTNGKRIDIYINNERFSLEKGTIKDYVREIDFKKGILTRRVTWISEKGDEILYESERLVSFYEKHLMISKIRITPLNFDGDIKVVSYLEGDVKNITKENDPRIGVEFQGDELKVLECKIDNNRGEIISRTKSSNLGLICLMANNIKCDDQYDSSYEQNDKSVSHVFNIKAEKNKVIDLEKYIVYKSYKNELNDNLYSEVIGIVEEAFTKKYDFYKQKQKEFIDDFWFNTDILIDGDDATQQGIRFNMFHLLQSVGRDSLTNISAKGLTGEGYEGHYFWDTEIYILPFFLYTNPNIAKQLVNYRYNLLDSARKRAKEMQYKKGALYPWRTINGEECSAYFPAGTAQYHINGDIAYTVCKYVEATNDEEFMVEKGAEILIETARLWLEIGHFNSKGEFHICCVTGPDEYTAIVNNNVYTNLMAANNLHNAYKAAMLLQKKYPAQYKKLVDKINIEESEIDNFEVAANEMYVPYDEHRKLYPQDDSFFDKPKWDFIDSEDKHPLLMHYHPLNIYRAQVCKQADLILAEFLLGGYFDREQKMRDYDYYEKITTHDSSLSTCIFSIMANELGLYDKAYDYFGDSVRTDIDNLHNNTSAGIHTANMAGAWMSIIYGFAGMRVEDGILRFSPHLPNQWNSYRFRVSFRGRIIEVCVTKDNTEFKILHGEPIMIYNEEKSIKVV